MHLPLALYNLNLYFHDKAFTHSNIKSREYPTTLSCITAYCNHVHFGTLLCTMQVQLIKFALICTAGSPTMQLAPVYCSNL